MADLRFQRLLADHLLVCPTCERLDSMTDAGDVLRCEACSSAVPIVGGVPDFFTGYTDIGADPSDDPDHNMDAAVVADIASTLALPLDDTVRAGISTALRTAERDTDSPALTAEIREVHARFVGGDIDQPPLPTEANQNVHAAIERHYAPAGLIAGAQRFINLRLRNTGTEPWSSRTSPFAVTAASRFHRRSFGRRSATAPVYTPLPIDIEPGRAITLPVEVTAPTKPGRYLMELGLFHHPDGFVEDAGVRLEVEVHAEAQPDTRQVPAEVVQRPVIADYGEDHEVANGLVDAALDRFWPDEDRWIVEIGGSTHPQSWNHGRSHLVNVDISAPMLQLGALYDRYHDRSIVHLCADATQPPLAPGAWHAVTMFATLHHFPEPERLLATAAQLIRPGGFVAVMCEPTGTSLAHPAAVRDLLGGINEQTFAVDEYLWMAEQAGLEVESGFDDGGSLKAILRRR